MDIFDDMAQAVRFAFTLEQYRTGPGQLAASTVRVALGEAKIVLTAHRVACYKMVDIGAYAKKLLDAIKTDLLGYERAALIAAYSRNWPERRAAADTLGAFHARLLGDLLKDRNLVGKLVVRHYIAERERGASWALQSLADEHKAAGDRVKRSARLIDENARKLEKIALDTLSHALAPQPQPEPSHA